MIEEHNGDEVLKPEEPGADEMVETSAAQVPEAETEAATEEAPEPAEEEPERVRKPRPIRQPPGLEMFSANGTDIEEMKQELFKQSKGRELYYQEYTQEDESTTVYGYLRSAVLDLVYDLAFPIAKLIDSRAVLKVKSNRAVTEFYVIIQTRRAGAFIGQHGKTLDSLETLITHSVSRLFPRWVTINVDVDKYRQKRQAYLEGMIKKVVREIERDHRERPLRDLLPKERKFVHQYFAEHPYLATESRGVGPKRTLFIVPRDDIKEV